MTSFVWMANVLGWPALQLGLSGLFLHLPVEWFENDNPLTAPRSWEHEGRLYRDGFAIRKWKPFLPDGAPWLGGLPKKSLCSRQDAQLARFLLETRRAELAHWIMLACLPVFFLWNPAWARWVMTFYALAANLPCIVAQRYNRVVLARVIAARRRLMDYS